MRAGPVYGRSGIRYIAGLILGEAITRNVEPSVSMQTKKPQVVRPTRARVRMRLQGTEHPVGAMRFAKADGAKGVYAVASQAGQPEYGRCLKDKTDQIKAFDRQMWKIHLVTG
jgi:hypothetical protein